MLRPEEFTVGEIGQGEPLSLIFPRRRDEAMVLIGETDHGPAAVFLSDPYKFLWFSSEGNDAWKGLIVPNVDIEVDETSLYDVSGSGQKLGSLIRTGSKLFVCAKQEQYGGASLVALRSGLADAGDYRAGFSRWRIVVGDDRRELAMIDLNADQG